MITEERKMFKARTNYRYTRNGQSFRFCASYDGIATVKINGTYRKAFLIDNCLIIDGKRISAKECQVI
jgi:hypothetical protein